MTRGAAAALIALVALLVSACTAQAPTSWQVLGPSDGSEVLCLAADAHIPQIIYAGTSSGQVLRTRTDARGTSPGTGLPADSVVPAIAVDPAVGGVVYAGTSSGLYETTNYGDTWKARGSGLPQDDTVDALIFDGTDATTLYAGTEEHGVYRSQDAGTTWSPLNDGLPTPANVYTLAYDPATSTIFASLSGGPGIFGMSPGGSRWIARNTGLPAHVEVFALLPMAAQGATAARIYAGTSQGVYVSTDAGGSWAPSGLSGTRVLALASDPTTPGTVYAGTNQSVDRGVDGQAWQQVASAVQHPVAAIVARQGTSSGSIVFAGSQNILRYPPNVPPTSVLSTVLTVVLLLVLAGAFFYVGRRNVRILGQMSSRSYGSGGRDEGARSPDTPGQGRPGSGVERDEGSRSAHNGHDPGQQPS